MGVPMDDVSSLWRTVRFFISDDGVDEVSFDAGGRVDALRCTCEDFKRKAGCSHVAFVRSVDYEDGLISIEVPADELHHEDRWRRRQIDNGRITALA